MRDEKLYKTTRELTEGEFRDVVQYILDFLHLELCEIEISGRLHVGVRKRQD